LKKGLQKRKPLNSVKLLCRCILFLCFLDFASCKHQAPYHNEKDTAENIYVFSAIRQKHLSQPKITYITSVNQPEVIKAGKPVVKIDSSNGGAPFFTDYGIDQGLPLNNIICSATDKSGNLWFGTGGGGASRYDGKSFTNYTMAHGLAGNIVFCIMEDKGGNIWMGTTSGLSKYDGKRFTNYSTSDGLAGNFVTCILQDNEGNIWIGTHDGGINKYDGKSFTTYTTAQGLADNYVRCMIKDRKGNLWLGTEAGGISRYDGHRFTNYTKAHGLANNSVNCITQDNDDNLWFGTIAGVSKFNGSSFTNYTTKQGLADNNISSILQDKDGVLWFGMQSKNISRYDGSRFINYSRTEKPEDYKVNSILQDQGGNLWFSSQGGGVSKYEGNSFTSYNVAQGLPANLVFWIIQDRAGSLWFGTYDGGVSKYDGKRFTNYSKAQGLADNKIWSILEDEAGNIWFGTDRGLSKFNGSSFTNYTTKQGLANDAVISMMQDKAGNLWFGTRANGVSKYDGRSFTNYTSTQGLAGNGIWGMVQDQAGKIWFATHDGGISKYDGNSFTNYTTAQGLPGNAVSIIHLDKMGILWIGTDGKGVSKYDGKTFINYTNEDGLADNVILNISEDTSRNEIWFGTAQGLSGIKEHQIRNSKNQQNEFENFNKLTGYPLKDVSTGALFVDDKGIVWMGSGEGKLIRFDYSTIHKTEPRSLNLQIQAVKVNNETICWNALEENEKSNKSIDSLTLLNEMMTSFGKVLSPETLSSIRKKYRQIHLDGVAPYYPVPINLVLPYNDNTITIDFAAIEPALQKQVKYQYKLEGYNTNWSSSDNSSSAVFGNMKAGQYTFRLKALSPSGMWSETTYTFRVLPPWWSTWWAYTLYTLLAGGIVYTLYRSHIQNLKRKQNIKLKTMMAAQEEERKRISRDLHDDIGARLTNINMLSALGQNHTNGPLEMAAYLKRISGEIQSSADLLDDIVWNIDSKNDAIEEVTARMRRYAANFFDGTSMKYNIVAEDASLPPKLSSGKRRDLFFVFKEAINNTQKHAMATVVDVLIEGQDGKLCMLIIDNGKGFETGQPSHRNGLKNINERIEKWGGNCTIQSYPGKGTTLKIILPLESTSLKRGRWNWFKWY
jgi:ligand-binding sensor domain-containing protein/signal transduction histidine kinase